MTVARPRTPIGTFGEIYVREGPRRSRPSVDPLPRLRRPAPPCPGDSATPRRPPSESSRSCSPSAPSRTSAKASSPAASSFRHLVEVWLADLDLEDALAPSTRALYERNMRQLVLPAFEHYALREISVRKVDQFIKTLAKTKSYSMAKQARTVLSLAFGLAVRYDAIAREPGPRHRAPPQAARRRRWR